MCVKISCVFEMELSGKMVGVQTYNMLVLFEL
jgi:hypothetical protein